jgi:hypothetical protein
VLRAGRVDYSGRRGNARETAVLTGNALEHDSAKRKAPGGARTGLGIRNCTKKGSAAGVRGFPRLSHADIEGRHSAPPFASRSASATDRKIRHRLSTVGISEPSPGSVSAQRSFAAIFAAVIARVSLRASNGYCLACRRYFVVPMPVLIAARGVDSSVVGRHEAVDMRRLRPVGVGDPHHRARKGSS